ncbi:MAG: hypothetical protein B6I20_12980 [Bacteroidetes bacterium 4572_117]|nr:MAG: hypothetical protein B6I20_12980 [Bacteroidetes bacterium 4572_117]
MKTKIYFTYLVLVSVIIATPSLAQKKTKKIVTAEFTVKGVCKMCKERIENAALIKGVKFAEWDKQTNKLKVVFNSQKTTLDKIHKSIADAGHDTDKLKGNDGAYKKLPKCCAYRDGAKKH